MPSLAQRWLEQGKQQGIQQGIQQAMHELVLEAIETKFGKIRQGIRERILQVTDKDKLKEIHRTVLKAEDIDELEKSSVWK